MCSCFQQLNKRQLRRSRSLISTLLWGGGDGADDDDFGKAKNVRQTELLVDLREAILQIARHFQSIDPKNNKFVRSHSHHSRCYVVLLIEYLPMTFANDAISLMNNFMNLTNETALFCSRI